jgi:glycosyltransferase involved in cell wall biosynthesis
MRIALLASYSTVPRSFQMATLLSRAGYNVSLIEWDRKCERSVVEMKKDVRMIRLRLRAPYGISLFPFIGIWMLFICLYLLAHKFDVVQPQNLDSLIPAWFTSKIRHFKIIYDLADFYGDAYLGNMPIVSELSAFIERKLVKLVDALIVVSEKVIVHVGKENLPAKYAVIYNSPEAGVYVSHESKERKFSASHPFTLIYAGILSMDRVRLLLNVIRAMQYDRDVKILIAGFGSEEKVIRKIASKNRNVIFLGKIEYEEVLLLTLKSDLVILPYDSRLLNNRISLPNKLFEAVMCGRPVIVSSNTYMSYIASTDGFGISVNFENLEEVKQAISLLKEDKSLRSKMSQAGSRAYREKYSWELLQDRLLELYEFLPKDQKAEV